MELSQISPNFENHRIQIKILIFIKITEKKEAQQSKLVVQSIHSCGLNHQVPLNFA